MPDRTFGHTGDALLPADGRRAWRAVATAIGLLAMLFALGPLARAEPAHGAPHDMREGVMWTEHYSQPRHAQHASAQGTEVVRLPIRWNEVSREPPGAPGPLYDWSTYDALIERLARNRIDVVLNFFGTARWAAERTRSGSPITRRPPIRSHQDEWRRFVQRTVRRYAPGGRFWLARSLAGDPLPPHPVREYEIWNEPNINPNWRDGRVDAADYGRFMVDTARAVRAGSPQARVLGLSLCYCGVNPRGYIAEALGVHRGLQAIDAVSYHAYKPGHRAQVVAALNVRAWLRDAGAGGKPMHLTEFGWGTCDDLYRQRVCVTPQQQAFQLGQAFEALERLSGRLRLEAAHWFLHEDLCERTDDRCDQSFFGHFGLSYLGGERKPAWDVYRQQAAR